MESRAVLGLALEPVVEARSGGIGAAEPLPTMSASCHPMGRVIHVLSRCIHPARCPPRSSVNRVKPCFQRRWIEIHHRRARQPLDFK